jgi:ribonuclease Z
MEKLNIAGVTLEGVAQGGWQTAIHVPEAFAVFDAGTVLPGVSVDHIFVTHGHPDHIGALPAITARRAIQDSRKPLQIHLPAGISDEVGNALHAMDRVFGDRSEHPFRVCPTKHDDVIRTGPGIAVRAMRTYHGVATCGWAVEQTVRKLKPEFLGMAGPDIAAMKQRGVEITDEKTNTMVVIPGDTTIEFLLREEQARKAKVLLHEVTFWDEKSSIEGCRRFGHTHVDEMIEHCEKFEGEALVLVHRSMKYKRAEVEEILRKRFPASMLPRLHLFDGGDR